MKDIENSEFFLEKFGQRIKDLRKLKNFSQEMLASYSELDRTYIGGVERGERDVSLINIHKIAKALNVDIKELFNYE